MGIIQPNPAANPQGLFGGQFANGFFIGEGEHLGKKLFDCSIKDVLDERDMICYADDMADLFNFTTIEACLLNSSNVRVFKEHTIKKAGKIGEDGRPNFLKPDGVRGSKAYPTISKYGDYQHMSEDFEFWMSRSCPCEGTIFQMGLGSAAEMAENLLEALKIAEMADMFSLLYYAWSNDVAGNGAGSGGFFGDPLIGEQLASSDDVTNPWTNEIAPDGVTMTTELYMENDIDCLAACYKKMLEDMKDAALCQKTPSCQPYCPPECHTIYAGKKLAKVLRRTLGLFNQDMGCCTTVKSCGQNIALYTQNAAQCNPTINDFLYHGQGFNLVEVPYLSREWFNLFCLDSSKLPSDEAGTVADPDWMFFVMDSDFIRRHKVFVRVRGQAAILRTFRDDMTEKYIMASKGRFGFGHFGFGLGIFGGFKIPEECLEAPAEEAPKTEK